ncbi:Tigger transposable element-derived protein 7 [Portunus trituberculatus]|uniref:Tigger transposable element-derived protein 7 n=1 Tax=Portunus trituberculatus TaxID=210409 RepID=A0A5B7ETX0_PORTR|nr:Tigger transposable element-derived protein 7 [Portunus trituberculatus]
MKWYVQERSVGINVHGVEIMSAAKRLVVKLGLPDFKASDGWLWCFRNRHGLFNATNSYLYTIGVFSSGTAEGK